MAPNAHDETQAEAGALCQRCEQRCRALIEHIKILGCIGMAVESQFTARRIKN